MDWINTSYLANTFHGVFVEQFWEKIVIGFGYGIVMFLFDVNQVVPLQAVVALTVMHFVIGVIAAYKRGDEIRADKAIASAVKLAVYGICISAGFLAEKAVQAELLFDQTITGFIAIAELIAILRKGAEIGVPVPESFFKRLDAVIDKEIKLK